MPNAELISAGERLLREFLLREPALERPRRREALPQFLISSMYAPPAVPVTLHHVRVIVTWSHRGVALIVVARSLL